MVISKHRSALIYACLAAVILLLSSATHATASSNQSTTVSELSQNPTWLHLLHYEPAHNQSAFASQVDDPDFFLSPAGKTDPLQEIKATLAAFYQPAATPDQHTVCRYPARWRFLQQALQLSAPAVNPQDCPELNSWLAAMQPHSVSLIFASAYLNSPSSMFGHTFLRIDPENVDNGSTWLSYAVNFGAEISGEDNSILYAYKGLFGGYPGFFSVIRYYEKIKEYSRIENRDLWEYNLNLTPEETRNLTLHLWELRNIDFDYYFFDENCSYRLLELLEVARPGTELTAGFELRAIPVDTVRAVRKVGMIASIDYRPSVATQIEHEIQQLNEEQQHIAWQLAHGEIAPDDASIRTLPPEQQAQIVALAYEHLRYRQLERARDDKAASYSLELLTKLSQLPSKPSHPATPQTTPDNGHKTLLAGWSGGTDDGTGFTDLRLRLSYHDLVDNADGYLDGAAINIGELRLRKAEQDSAQIETLNLVDINSHAPRSLFFNPITWRVTAGFERLYSRSDDDLVAQVHGGAGVSYRVAQRSIVYTLAMARLEYNELLNHNWTLGAGALAGALVYLPIGTLQFETGYYQFTDGSERYSSQLTHNLPLNKNNALRISATHQSQLDQKRDEFSLEFRHYF